MTGAVARAVWWVVAALLLLVPALPLPRWSGARDAGPVWAPEVSAWGFGLVVVVVVAALAGRLGTGLRRVALRWPPLRPATAVAALGVGLSLAAAWVMRSVFASNPQLVDEIAQLWHAQVFADGRLEAPGPVPADAFMFTHTWIAKGGWVSLYPPGQAALLALGLLVRAEWLVNPLLGGASVALVYRTAHGLYGRRTGLAAAFLWATSAWVLFMSGTYMNHVGAVTFALVAWALTLGARRPAARHYAAAGLALGLAAATRPLDAVAAALPVLAWGAVGRRWRAFPWMAVGGVPVLAAWAYINWRTFGSPLVLGYTAVYGREFGLGFGLDPWGGPFTPLVGLSNLAVAVRRLHLYLYEWPIPALLPLALWGVAARRRTGRDLVVGVGALAAPALYFFYWHSGFYPGPRFYYPAAPFLVIATARAWRWGWAAARRARVHWLRIDVALATAAAVVLVWGWVSLLPRRVRQYHTGFTSSTLKLHPERDLARLGVRQALVLVPESWGSRTIVRLWALGVPPGVAERAYHRLDTCDLHQFAMAAAAGGWAPPETVSRLEARISDEPAPAPPVASWPDPTIRLRPAYRPPEACLVELQRDLAGFTLYGQLAWRNRVGLDAGIVFARDLYDRNDLVLARYPGWQVWRYAPPVGSPGAPPVLARVRPVGPAGAP